MNIQETDETRENSLAGCEAYETVPKAVCLVLKDWPLEIWSLQRKNDTKDAHRRKVKTDCSLA